MDDESKETETTKAASEPAAEPVSDLWAVSYSDDDDRELSSAEVARALELGEIDGTTIVWRPGMADWQPLGQTAELAVLLDRGAGTNTVSPEPATIATGPASERRVQPDPPASTARSHSRVPVALPTPELDALAFESAVRGNRYGKLAALGAGAAVAAGGLLWSLQNTPDTPGATGTANPPAAPLEVAAPNATSTVAGNAPVRTASSGTGSAAFRYDHVERDLPPFDRVQALRRMAVVGAKATRCRGKGTPAGVAYVTVTFEPSGTISKARILQAPYAGTPTAKCIVNKIGATRVAPFNGPPVTLRVPIELL
jgi:hypothetical protein